MVGFRTKSGTIYYINQQEKLFYGGKFKYPTPYVEVRAIVGTKALITLTDGRVVQTSEVIAYV